MAKRVVVTVISDLVTDQRVHKVSETLLRHGYDVLLIGAQKKESPPLTKRTYQTKRLGLVFRKHFPFYAEFNTRLFFSLLFTKADIILGNDLDVMAATYLAARLKRIPVIYDSHEYYLGMAGLANKPLISKVWKALETQIFKRVKFIYTVCDSVAGLYWSEYGKKLRVVRNVPWLNNPIQPISNDFRNTIDPYFHSGKFILLFQGAGINPHRGVEELVQAMSCLSPEKYHLLIVGDGDVFPSIKKMVREFGLTDRITLIPKVPLENLRYITEKAQLGLSLDKETNLNTRLSLPNKLFDYLHAGIPVLSSRLIESERIIDKYQVGTYIENHEPAHIALVIERIFQNPGQIEQWKANTVNVRNELNWEAESQIVIDIFKQVESETVNKGR